MIPVYLGFVETLAEVVSKTVAPLLEMVIKAVLGITLSCLGIILKNVLYGLWFLILRTLLRGIYIITRVFDVVSGMADISVVKGGTIEHTSLISYFLQASFVSRFLMGMTVGAAVLAFLFAVYETGKSISDLTLDAENAKPISKVLKNGLYSAFAFMLVPILCVFCLQLSSLLVKETRIAFSAARTESTITQSDKEVEFSDVLFQMAGEKALKVNKTSEDYEKFWSVDEPYQDADKMREETVYNLKEIDYAMGISSSLILLVILIGSSLGFVRRIVDVLLLYIVSPYFSATIALDGGKRFKRWRESFIGAFFGCFGSVFAMRIYLLIIPALANDSIRFSEDNQVNYVAKVLFMIGGMWAIFKAQDTITGLISPTGSGGAGESMALISGASFKLGKSLGKKIL